MKIVVKDLDDEIADVEVKPESKVEEIATQVISKWKLDSNKRMRIMFGGRQLEYNEIVEECKLSDGDVVRILIKPKKTAEKLKDVEEDEIQTALQFWKRVKKYLNQVEGKTRDAWLYIGQSWNQLNLKSRRKVQISFDTNLDEDWKKVFKEAAAKIVKAAPGIELITGESLRTIDLNERKTIYEYFYLDKLFNLEQKIKYKSINFFFNIS